jgi:peptidoglycan/xylan/chitin deacetylase (PgdA/CDA1 family)
MLHSLSFEVNSICLYLQIAVLEGKHMKAGVLYVSLTFDDGYVSNYDVAKYLSAIGIKATFFITTHLKERLFLSSTPKKIVEISELGHEVGSHSCTHPFFVSINKSEREHELIESKRWLEDLLEKKISSFAYPYFLYNKEVLQHTHKFYQISRSRHLHVGSDKVNTYNVHFLTRKNVLHVFKNLHRDGKNYALITLHDVNPLQIKLLLIALKANALTMLLRIRFVTIRELASLLDKQSAGYSN